MIGGGGGRILQNGWPELFAIDHGVREYHLTHGDIKLFEPMAEPVRRSKHPVARVAGMDENTSSGGLPGLLSQLCDLPPSEVRNSSQFRLLAASQYAKVDILSSIPLSSDLSHRPLHLLCTLLTDLSGSWPVSPLIRCHNRLYQSLPEPVKSAPDMEIASTLDTAARLVKGSYSSVSDFISSNTRPALRSPNSNKFISYRGLHDFVSNFHLPAPVTTTRKPTVAIALPNGPLLACICVATTTYYTAAPINPAVGVEQFRADVMQAGAQFVLTSALDYEKLQLQNQWIRSANIRVLCVDWDGGDGIKLVTPDGNPLPRQDQRPDPNTAEDVALVLFTSGTSGTKKVVPLTLHSLIAGVAFVVDSWGLTANDTCLNMMPLYHVGGLVRNIFAPIFSGGCTVCCSAFEPSLFWDVVDELQPTWYYASPSMHSLILAEASERPASRSRSRIRLVCNAAGGLLPSLAGQLRDTFNCTVLPSYGMTECMPISSPPLNYQLDREGTSGISTGPEISVLDWSEEQVPTGTTGRICVRGEPVFPGYLRPDGSFDRKPFNAEGWFDTGDLGYLDHDGYLYITGRSKEVINRGGELISPFEVENAILTAAVSDSPIRGRVCQALAFSVPHSVLQEVVAVALVTPPDVPKVDLKSLHAALQSSLQQAKWPVLVTFMDDLPKRNNKVLRIDLGKRLDLPYIEDDAPHLSRHWTASCPPADTEISVAIESSPCSIDYNLAEKTIGSRIPPDVQHHCLRHISSQSYDVILAPVKLGAPVPLPQLAVELREHLSVSLDNYMMPDKVHVLSELMPTDNLGGVDETELRRLLDLQLGATLHDLDQSIEGKVIKAFAETLSRHPTDIPPDVDFFQLGGDSLRAGRLLSALRSAFNVQLPVGVVFNQGTVRAISAHVERAAKVESCQGGGESAVGCTTTYSSTSPILMAWQLIPIVVVYPLRRAFQWTIFIALLSQTQDWPTHGSVPGRLINVLACITLARVIIQCVAPIVGIVAKWVIIGRYRQGLYPMWGWYHSRWWMVQKIESICGMGVFDYSDRTRRLYCRLMGARVGQNVKLEGSSLGEWDLLDIRDGATLTRCICRPFAAEGNTSMYLGRITIGERSSIGISSIIAAGSNIPPNTCIGPNSSSWELADADEANRDLSPAGAPKPHWVLTCLLTWPLVVISRVLSLVPWAAGLVGMVLDEPRYHNTPLRDMLDWFTTAERVAYHYLALTLRTFFGPFVLFGFAVLVKSMLDVMFGKLGHSSAKDGSSVTTWRAHLVKMLIPSSQLHHLTSMFGQHYEGTSIAYRMLGSRVGKRVYWPGTGPDIGDYHLLNVGNDVVFGSRAHLVTTDASGSERITIQDRAMIADRVCLLPGVEIGEGTTMGSGALTRRGQSYEAGGTFVGSKGGDAVCLSTGRFRAKEKRRRRTCLYPSGSDVTLTGDSMIHDKERIRTHIQHAGSDKTLAESQTSSRTGFPNRSPDPFLSSDSDSDDNGDESASKTVSPFGRAFYLKLAPYHVLGPVSIFFYSAFMAVFVALYWNVPSVSSIQIVDHLMNHLIARGGSIWIEISVLFSLTLLVMAVLTTIQAIFALIVVVVAKWALLGRRQPGNYDWDRSSYCQRWQLFLCIEKLRRQCYCGQGILGLLTGTSWLVLYFRALGAKIGKDCALFANGRPSLMFTEPDLITLGDRVVVDDASVVAHINTRGKFDLNRLEVGSHCVLRTGSRLLSGAKMKKESCLLEHTLILGGDVVEEQWTMQGWPAERFLGRRIENGL
ncbi:hypothetical protein CDD83_1137 [Cordyceps sp. RAO-2017]|nr:hypothetical protein CDD83_1137 [Cordyceps sp. RAO-2017]